MHFVRRRIFRSAYGTDKTKFAIKDVSLAVNPGEIVAILGPSGCGKSTLLRSLIGLVKPTNGRVLAEGVPLVGINPRVALVFQSFALYPWLTVRENIAIALGGAGDRGGGGGKANNQLHRYWVGGV